MKRWIFPRKKSVLIPCIQRRVPEYAGGFIAVHSPAPGTIPLPSVMIEAKVTLFSSCFWGALAHWLLYEICKQFSNSQVYLLPTKIATALVLILDRAFVSIRDKWKHRPGPFDQGVVRYLTFLRNPTVFVLRDLDFCSPKFQPLAPQEGTRC